MSDLQNYLIPLFIYLIAARYSLLISNKRVGHGLFVFVNVGAFVWLSLMARYNTWNDETILSLGAEVVLRHILLILAYVVVIAAGYYLTRVLAHTERFFLVAFLYPIFLLVGMRFFPGFWGELLNTLDWQSWTLAMAIVGLSYMAFRLSYLVLEVRNGLVSMPSLPEYLGFAFFLPTLLIGPINRFATHQQSIAALDETRIPVQRALLRITVGTAKYFFLANLANQLSYSGIFMDGHPHGIFDLAVAVVFYYLFLYLNFSGFCDIAIGGAALIGIMVTENFDNPFAARNVKDFWNRWHITLSQYTRDVIFAPLSTVLVRKLGPSHMNFSIAVAVTAVFLVIGIWHGVGWRFVIFGLIHAVGIITNHYYTVWMKRLLGRERYKLYYENPVVNVFAVGLTFIYVAGSFAVFANSRDMLVTIKDALAAGLQL
jgi:membrane protein involved in D-alanine export